MFTGSCNKLRTSSKLIYTECFIISYHIVLKDNYPCKNFNLAAFSKSRQGAISYKCSPYFAKRNMLCFIRRDEGIKPGFKNICIALEIVVTSHKFCTASSLWCSSFSDTNSRLKYVFTRRRCYRRADRYICLQEFLTSLLYEWPLVSKGRYFSRKKYMIYPLPSFSVTYYQKQCQNMRWKLAK